MTGEPAQDPSPPVPAEQPAGDVAMEGEKDGEAADGQSGEKEEEKAEKMVPPTVSLSAVPPEI